MKLKMAMFSFSNTQSFADRKMRISEMLFFLTNLSFHRYKMFLIRIEKKAIEIQGWFSYGCPFHHNPLIATPILRK